MSEQITIRVDDELSFMVEVNQDTPGTTAPAGRDLPPGARPTSKVDPMGAAEDAFAAIGAYLRRTALAATRPDELAVEFSVALKGSSGIPVLVSTGAEAAFKVTATWKGAERAAEAADELMDD